MSCRARSPLGQRLQSDERLHFRLTALGSLAVSLAYGLYQLLLGLMIRSVWLLAAGAYTLILGVTRFAARLCRRSGASPSAGDVSALVPRLSGALLLSLSVVLALVNYLSVSRDLAARYGTIPMITIACYTFTKLTLAILRGVRQRRDPSPLAAVIRRVGYADVAAAILTLQRSMLVSFGPMPPSSAVLMNGLTGGAVFLFVALLGLSLLQPFRKLRSNTHVSGKDHPLSHQRL